MLENYLLIHKSILPEYYEKVLEARRLLEDGKAKEVSQAVRMVGISRSTYYKYKDFILEPMEMTVGHKAVLSMMLTHEPGILSTVLTRISDAGGSVLTITQSLPIHGRASVTLSLDVSSMGIRLAELLEIMEKTPGVEKPRLLAVE
ncbi:MAG: ACT domain-containing protein [Clostridiales bacterium]|nr:ACT domain-containing protein [Clostridiales bacterium]